MAVHNLQQHKETWHTIPHITSHRMQDLARPLKCCQGNCLPGNVLVCVCLCAWKWSSRSTGHRPTKCPRRRSEKSVWWGYLSHFRSRGAAAVQVLSSDGTSLQDVLSGYDLSQMRWRRRWRTTMIPECPGMVHPEICDHRRGQCIHGEGSSASYVTIVRSKFASFLYKWQTISFEGTTSFVEGPCRRETWANLLLDAKDDVLMDSLCWLTMCRLGPLGPRVDVCVLVLLRVISGFGFRNVQVSVLSLLINSVRLARSWAWFGFGTSRSQNLWQVHWLFEGIIFS